MFQQLSMRPLELATNILKARLSRRLPLGLNIISPYTAELPNDLNEHAGNFVGFFIWLDTQGPAFVLLSRNLPTPFGISHVHIFYVNQEASEVRIQDQQRFSSKKLASHVKFCIVNLRSKAPKFLDLSVLIQALEVYLRGAKLELAARTLIGVSTSECLLLAIQRPMKMSRSLDCCGQESNEFCSTFARLQNLGFKYCVLSPDNSPGTIPSDVDILRIRISGWQYGGLHYVYGIHYKPIKIMMLLLTHPYLFQQRDHYQSVAQLILNSMAPYKLRFIGATRYYGLSHDTKCHGDDVLRACLLAQEQPMIMIKQSDLDIVITDAYFSQRLSERDPESQFTQSTGSLVVVDPNVGSESIQFSPSGCGQILSGVPNMNIASSTVSTQATEIFDPSEVMSEVRAFNAQLQLREDISDLSVPPIQKAVPFNDPYARYFHDDGLFTRYFKTYVNLWSAYASVKALDPIHPSKLSHAPIWAQSERFTAQPVLDRKLVFVVLYDKDSDDCAYLNPYFGGDPLFADAARVVSRAMRNNEGRSCRSIGLTSYFHPKWARIHILMGAFYLGKLFKEAVMLPQRVFYLERDFRHFCWRLYHALQVSNAEYNLSQSLVDELGYLKQGAMTQIGSPVSYTPAVVSRKECPFCGSRKWDNLSSHVRMSHGGLATRARRMRALREECRGQD